MFSVLQLLLVLVIAEQLDDARDLVKSGNADDVEKGIALYEKLANEHQPKAMVALGTLYFLGREVRFPAIQLQCITPFCTQIRHHTPTRNAS